MWQNIIHQELILQASKYVHQQCLLHNERTKEKGLGGGGGAGWREAQSPS